VSRPDETIPEKEISHEDALLSDLFTDPNSRFQEGGTGYLRIPLDAPRTDRRADAPEWLDCRESFLRTLRKPRAERAELILQGFYVEEKTDEQIAEAVGWAKDSIKKERKHLINEGNNFFRVSAAKHPPSPAITEGHGSNPPSVSSRATHFLPNAASQKTLTSARPRKDFRVLPTGSIAVRSPEPNVLRLDPVFEDRGERFAKTADGFVRLVDLKGFLREETAAPRSRRSHQIGEAAD
jgi:hypothetical protein